MAAMIQGASADVRLIVQAADAWVKSGQPKAARPTTEATPMARAPRLPTAVAPGPASWPSWGQARRHLGHGQPRRRGQDPGHLGSETRRMTHHLAGGAVADDLPVGQDHHPVGGLGHQLHVVGGDDDGVTLGGQAPQDGGEPGLGRVVEAPGGFVEEDEGRGRGQDDGQGQGQPLTLGQVAGMGVIGECRA